MELPRPISFTTKFTRNELVSLVVVDEDLNVLPRPISFTTKFTRNELVCLVTQ